MSLHERTGFNPDVLDTPDAASDFKGDAVSAPAKPADAGEGGGSDEDDDI